MYSSLFYDDKAVSFFRFDGIGKFAADIFKITFHAVEGRRDLIGIFGRSDGLAFDYL